MNTDISNLRPGVFGVSAGAGVAGEIIRHATGSQAGHAFLYLGDGQIVSGQPPRAVAEPATRYPDAIWAWRMWDQLKESGWQDDRIARSQRMVAARGQALVGTKYDWAAYLAFAAEVLHLRNEGQVAAWFKKDADRVCSADVYDALTAGGVPVLFVPGDGPDLLRGTGKTVMPANLVAPGMLLGLAERLDWT